ncbi:MAG TPA: class I SAM-dependent methyltransferase [Terriglobales bacterium]|jgi:ubiquinone/menaquinone biosynthesis C-methylase UbiE|nr:class I SAM-dependent methyltransferase [Terriglobales bacterium]
MGDRSHKAVVQESFTQQAEAYAVAPAVADPDRIARFVEAIAPNSNSRLLDVACGPGFLALAFAKRCRETVGIDLTRAPLKIARRNREKLGLKNADFLVADADYLPFPDETFDVVVSRLALHHLQDPGSVLREMARVCRTNGKLAVEDLLSSEHQERARFHNEVEQLRDPSHTRALARSELLRVLSAAALETERVFSSEVVHNLERWLANTQTPPDKAARIRKMIEIDAREEKSDLRPFFKDGEWFFHHSMLAIMTRKSSSSEE